MILVSLTWLQNTSTTKAIIETKKIKSKKPLTCDLVRKEHSIKYKTLFSTNSFPLLITNNIDKKALKYCTQY